MIYNWRVSFGNYLLFIFIIFFLLIGICNNATAIQKKQQEKINFLWERYLLLKLYLQYNEQNSKSFPKDINQALMKIDFSKLPYFTSKLKSFYFTLKPIDYNLSPKLIDKLYDLDKKKKSIEVELKTYRKIRINELVQECQQKRSNNLESIDMLQKIQNDEKLNDIDMLNDILILKGLKELCTLQDEYTQAEHLKDDEKIQKVYSIIKSEANNFIKNK